MNKIIIKSILLCTALLAITSCVKDEEDDLFSKSAAERLNETSATYTQSLLKSPHGWIMEYYPQDVEINEQPTDMFDAPAYLMLVKFNKDNSVRVGMNNYFTAYKYKEDTSLWEVITDNGPVLSFNTHNDCIHAFSLPDDIAATTGAGKNERGKGMLGDYEFVMVDVPESGEYIMLKGKKRGTYTRLTALGEETDFETYLKDVQNYKDTLFSTTAPNNFLIDIEGKQYRMINGCNDLKDYPTGTRSNRDKMTVMKIWEEGSDSVFTRKYIPYLFTRQKESNGNYVYSLRLSHELDGQKEFFIHRGETALTTADGKGKIVGQNANNFFIEALQKEHSWVLSKKEKMSANANEAVAALDAQAKKIKYSFDGLTISSIDGSTVVVTSTFKFNNNPRNAKFTYNISYSDSSVTLQYVEPTDAAGTTILNSLPALQNVLNLLNGASVVKGLNSFDLTNVSLTNGETRFVFDYTK